MNRHAINLPTLDVNCPDHATRVEKAITSVPTLAASSVDLSAQTATLSGDPSSQAARNTVIAVREAEYAMATNKHLSIAAGITCGGRPGSVMAIPSPLPDALAVAVDIPLKRATVRTANGTVTSAAIPSDRCGNDTLMARDIFFSWGALGMNGSSTAGTVDADMTGSQRTPHFDYADGAFHYVWGEAGNGQPCFTSSTLIGSVPFHELAGCRSLKRVSC